MEQQIVTQADIQSFLNEVGAAPKSAGERLQQEKDDLFRDVDSILASLKKDPALMKTILQKSADFPERSINNVILIGKHMPGATHLETLRDWKNKRVWVNNLDNGLPLLKQGKPYLGNDGKTRYSYNVVKYYDISDTAMRQQAPAPKPKAAQYIQAMGKNPPCAFQFVKRTEKDREAVPGGALYVPDTNTLYVDEALKKQPESCLLAISRELSHREQYVQNRQDYNRENPDTAFAALCTQIIVAERCGIDVKEIEIPPDLIPGESTGALKSALAAAHRDANRIYDRMEKGLPTKEQEKAAAVPTL